MTSVEQSFATAPELTDTLKKYQNTSAFLGLVGLAALVAAYFTSGAQIFLRSYLTGFWFWFGMGVGCLGMLMLSYLAGGAWGVVVRRPLEAGAKTLYFFVFGFLPILALAPNLYWWMTAAGQADKRIQQKSLYLNVPFLWSRWVLYVLFFAGVTYLLTKWSRLEDETRSMEYSTKLEKLSAPAMAGLFFLTTFCAVDYLMTLEPHWYSTMFGFIIVIGQALTAFCLIVAALVMLMGHAPMDYAVTKRHLHDLGKLMLALVMLWAYTNFGQILITWSGNLPDEIVYYMKRWNGGWAWIALILLIFHFCVPFALLLSQEYKKRMGVISKIAIFIVVVHAFDVYALVDANFADLNHPEINWATAGFSIAALLGFGGVWLALFFRNLAQAPSLLPTGDPNFVKALNHGRSH